MENQKKQMEEAAILYYEKKLTQNEIAQIMKLSRQTVSKLLNDAIKEGIVEIKIHNSEVDCAKLERALCERFHIEHAMVCGASVADTSLRQLMTVKKAADYVRTYVEKGNQKIGISWGRTIQTLISEFANIQTVNNVVFPLFGATDQEQAYFSSNEMARNFADKIGAKVKYAWFPYRPDRLVDGELFKKTSYFKALYDLWSDIDIAIIGIGNKEMIQTFADNFGYNENSATAIGDVATHFFDIDGRFLKLYENTLCVSKEQLRNAKQTIAIASGDDKVEAIIGALRTHVVDTLITDEYTARKILDHQ